MATKKAKILDDPAAVSAYMTALDHPLKAEAAAVRAIIMGVDPQITEGIKWNSPSFYYKGDMVVFNFHAQDTLRIVFPNGIIINDHTGLLEGDYPDRRLAYFRSMDDVTAKKSALESAIRGWITYMDQQS